jgi:uncharacterized membrane protein
VRGCDVKMLWLNLLFLLTIAFLPFTNALSAEHARPVTWALYSGTMAATGVAAAALWAYALQAGFVDPAMPEAARKRGWVGPLFMAGVFVLSIVLMYVWPAVAPWTFLLLILPALNNRVVSPVMAAVAAPVPPPVAEPPAAPPATGSEPG